MKLFFKLLVFIFPILFLSACSIPPHLQHCKDTTTRLTSERWNCVSEANDRNNQKIEREKLEQTQQEQLRRENAYAQLLQNRCENFGFQRGTNTFAQCILQQQQQDNINASNANALRLQQQQQGAQQLQQGLQMLSPQQRPSITCNRIPGTYTTTCQ